MIDWKAKGKELVTLLEDSGFKPRSYSGRGMGGKQCIAVSSHREYGPSLWEIAQALSDADIPEPREDSLGLGAIYYWPRYEWPEELG